MQPGSLVKYRERDWVVLPTDSPGLVKLRPIGGSAHEACNVFKPLVDLMGSSHPYERISPAKFPPPDAESSQDHRAVQMLMDASRLLLRDGAAPFRSLGHLAVRPRPYQFVPLLMALRLDIIRLLIADDVGIGKTIEAGLIARELLDRGEVRRVAVLCPPYLCDQWQAELSEKFNIEAEVFRSGTISRLERQCPEDTSVFKHYTHFVASIDTVKGDRYRDSFLLHCPELLIVDEVHGAASTASTLTASGKRGGGQQQRHQLLRRLAEKVDRHLILLTATPHSGVPEAFQSLLGLVKPEFGELDLAHVSQADSKVLAKHFVQRRRPDVLDWMGTDTPFPTREPLEVTYGFSNAYRMFYENIYNFARGLVQSASELGGNRARMRYWSALALLRAVSSSPAAAQATLTRRAAGKDAPGDDGQIDVFDISADELEDQFEPLIYDTIDTDAVVDAPPTAVLDAQMKDKDFTDGDRRKLREFAKQAGELKGEDDKKLATLIATVKTCLREGYHPIVWCRFIPTTEYLGEYLRNALAKEFKQAVVATVNGTASPEERRLKIKELGKAQMRVLVATDCLSEGINLQEFFDAAIHYDLPWNPNRLEQREGRTDRFGQMSPTVRTVLLYGTDNPVDGAVLDVLLRKAREIFRTLKVRVPVPTGSEGVMETVLNAIFATAYSGVGQLQLINDSEVAKKAVQQFHDKIDNAARREKKTQSRFAQDGIDEAEVQRELEATDKVLGDPNAVRDFLHAASERVGFGLTAKKDGLYDLGLAGLPEAVRTSLGDLQEPVRLSFDTPAPKGSIYVGRSHPLVEGLAEHLIDQAFYPVSGDGVRPAAARCGVIRTDAVSRKTTLLQLRLRFLLYEHGDGTPTLAEETRVWGYRGTPPQIEILNSQAASELMQTAKPTENVSPQEKTEWLQPVIDSWPELQSDIETLLDERAERLQAAHQRIRGITKAGTMRIVPQKDPDLLGVLLLLPAIDHVQSNSEVQA